MVKTKCVWVLAAAGVVVSLGAAAEAQQFAAIPCEIVTASQLASDQDATVRTFVAEWMTQLESAEIPASVEAREMLLRPFRECGTASVAFRVSMGRALQDRLVAAVRGSDERLAFDACQLAGRVASSETMRPLADALRDERASVRGGAATGYRDVLESVSQGNIAVGQASLGRALTSLQEALAAERDPVVAELLVHALGGASQQAAMHIEAMARMSEGMHDLAKRVRLADEIEDGAAWDHAFLAAATAAYQATLKLQISQMAPGEFGRWSGRMSGQFYAYARKRLEESGGASLQGTEEGRTLTALVEAADSLLQISHTWVSPGGETPARTLGAWRNAVTDDQPGVFVAALEPIIGVNGHLTKPPFGAQASEYR